MCMTRRCGGRAFYAPSGSVMRVRMQIIMQEQKLIGFTPFNDFHFKSCYYHHLLACYGYYGADRELLLRNYIMLYSTGRTLFREYSVLSKSQLRKKSGVEDKSLPEPENFIRAVIEYIDSGIPVIAAVDNYLLPYRRDDCKKHHVLHYILITGYDRERKKLHALEHMFENSYNYIPMEISFKTAENAHRSAVALGKTGRTFVAVYRHKPEAVTVTPAKKERLRRLILSSCGVKNELLLSIPALLSCPDRKALAALSRRLAVYRSGLLARAHAADMDGGSRDIELLHRTVNNITFIISSTYRASLTGGCDNNTLRATAARIKEVVQTEDRLHQALLRCYCDDKTY